MPCKGGRRFKARKLKYQLKTAINKDQDPFPLFEQLAQVSNNQPTSPIRVYKLIEITYNRSLPDYKTIPKGDPRRLAYKLLSLFGTEFPIPRTPEDPVLPPVESTTQLSKPSEHRVSD
jgi:hypothetical protein